MPKRRAIVIGGSLGGLLAANMLHSIGWHVDDIKLETANWYDVATVAATSHTRSGRQDGKYFYRVRTAFPAGPITIPSPWSNVISTSVANVPVPVAKADLIVESLTVTSKKGSGNPHLTLTAKIRNRGDAGAAASVTEFLLDGATVLGTVATPAIAAGGAIEVTIQWKPEGLNGEHSVKVTADRSGAVAESDENNNAVSRSWTFQNGKLQY